MGLGESSFLNENLSHRRLLRLLASKECPYVQKALWAYYKWLNIRLIFWK